LSRPRAASPSRCSATCFRSSSTSRSRWDPSPSTRAAVPASTPTAGRAWRWCSMWTSTPTCSRSSRSRRAASCN